jgi:hypothetical protein
MPEPPKNLECHGRHFRCSLRSHPTQYTFVNISIHQTSALCNFLYPFLFLAFLIILDLYVLIHDTISSGCGRSCFTPVKNTEVYV